MECGKRWTLHAAVESRAVVGRNVAGLAPLRLQRQGKQSSCDCALYLRMYLLTSIR